MPNDPSPEDTYSEEETVARREAALKRALAPQSRTKLAARSESSLRRNNASEASRSGAVLWGA